MRSQYGSSIPSIASSGTLENDTRIAAGHPISNPCLLQQAAVGVGGGDFS